MKEARRIEFFFEIFRILVALTLAFGFTLICIALMTDEPIEALKSFAFGPFSNLRRFGQMMGKFIPYLLVGSGMCFIYASNRFNMGGEGVYLMAGCIVAFIGVNLGEDGLPHILTILLLMIVGTMIGGGFGLIPAIMREKLNVNETVVSIMMNYGLMYLSTFLVKTLMVDPDISYLGSKPFAGKYETFDLGAPHKYSQWTVCRTVGCACRRNYFLPYFIGVFHQNLRIKPAIRTGGRDQYDPKPYHCTGYWISTVRTWRCDRHDGNL